eukprot:scaffold15392_cov19-Prasinocladus_malaysianus.AAC.2
MLRFYGCDDSIKKRGLSIARCPGRHLALNDRLLSTEAPHKDGAGHLDALKVNIQLEEALNRRKGAIGYVIYKRLTVHASQPERFIDATTCIIIRIYFVFNAV